MKQRPWLYGLEPLLLFAALFFTLPQLPSVAVERLPLLPAGLFAVALFAASRIIRWRRLWFMAIVETVTFAAFVWGSNALANLLYDA